MSECRKCGVAVEPGNVLCPDCAGTPRPVVSSVQPSGAAVGAAPARGTSPQGVAYDPSVIQGFARAMYDRAALVVAMFTVSGLFFACAIGFVLGNLGGGAEVGGVFGAFVGGMFGYFIGSMRANALRLEAQVALCQVEIERNTRS